MNKPVKYAAAALLTGAMMLAAASPGQARDGRNTAAAIGFGAGALVGAAVANSAQNGYYGPRYYYDEPAYAYEPGYVYEPAPTYYYGGRTRGRIIDGQGAPSCATDGGYGKVDYSNC